jgi:hypothetical protein
MPVSASPKRVAAPEVGEAVNTWDWRRVVRVMCVLVVAVGGLAMAGLEVALAGLLVAFHPGEAELTAAKLSLAAAVCCLVGCCFTVPGVRTPLRRRPLVVAGALYALATLLIGFSRTAHPPADGFQIEVLFPLALALVTPWWWPAQPEGRIDEQEYSAS